MKMCTADNSCPSSDSCKLHRQPGYQQHCFRRQQAYCNKYRGVLTSVSFCVKEEIDNDKEPTICSWTARGLLTPRRVLTDLPCYKNGHTGKKVGCRLILSSALFFNKKTPRHPIFHHECWPRRFLQTPMHILSHMRSLDNSGI